MNTEIIIKFSPFPEFTSKIILKIMPQGYTRIIQKPSQPIMINPADIGRLIQEGKEVMACNDFWFTSKNPKYPHLGLHHGMPACFHRVQEWSISIPWNLLSTLIPRWSNLGLIFTNSLEDNLTTLEYGRIEALNAIAIAIHVEIILIPAPISSSRQKTLSRTEQIIPEFSHQEVQIYGFIQDENFRFH